MNSPNQPPQSYEASFSAEPGEYEPRELTTAEIINGSASEIWLEQVATPDIQEAIAEKPALLDRLRMNGQIDISRPAIIEGAAANVEALLDEPNPEVREQLLDIEGPKYLRAIALTVSSRTLTHQQLTELQAILPAIENRVEEETFPYTNPHTGIGHNRGQLVFVSDTGQRTLINPNVLETAKSKLDPHNVGQFILEEDERERLTRIVEAQDLKAPPAPKKSLPEEPGRIKKAIFGENPKTKMQRLNQEREHADPDIPLHLTADEILCIRQEYFNTPGGSEMSDWDENPSYLITDQQLLEKAQEVAKRKLDLDFAIRAESMPLDQRLHEGIGRVALLETALPKPDVDSDLKDYVDAEVRRGLISLIQGSVAEIDPREAADIVTRSRAIDRDALDESYESTYRRSLSINRSRLIREVVAELEPLIANDQLELNSVHLAQIGEWIGEESRKRATKAGNRSRRKALREQEE